MTVENLPVFFLIMIGIGVMVIIIGIIGLAAIHEEPYQTKAINEAGHSQHLEELFSYFLQEEEKKNQNFREKILETSKTKEKDKKRDVQQESYSLTQEKNTKYQVKDEKQLFDDIIKRYQEGESIEMIAKNLKKGIGEVKLVISLYSMR